MRKEEYRESLYPEYLTRVQADCSGGETREDIEKKFPIWDAYYKQHLPPDRSSRIVDIGCGNGGFVHYLNQAGYGESSGIDISEEQVGAARRLGIAGVVQGDFRELLQSNPGVYDAVTARDVIEHFSKEEVLDVLQLISGALTEGGVCIIKTINAESPFWPRYRFGDFTHETSFTRTSIRSALLLSGFREIASYPVPPVIGYSRSSTLRYFLWKGLETVWKACLLIEGGDARGIFTGNLITVVVR